MQLDIVGWLGGYLGRWAGKIHDHCQPVSIITLEADLPLLNQKDIYPDRNEQLNNYACNICYLQRIL